MIRDHRYRVELVKIEIVSPKKFRVHNKNYSIDLTVDESNLGFMKIKKEPVFYYGRVIGSIFELIQEAAEKF